MNTGTLGFPCIQETVYLTLGAVLYSASDCTPTTLTLCIEGQNTKANRRGASAIVKAVPDLGKWKPGWHVSLGACHKDTE